MSTDAADNNRLPNGRTKRGVVVATRGGNMAPAIIVAVRVPEVKRV